MPNPIDVFRSVLATSSVVPHHFIANQSIETINSPIHCYIERNWCQSMSNTERLKFRIRRGDFEIELDGNFDYVKERFENLVKDVTLTTCAPPQAAPTPMVAAMAQSAEFPLSLKGIVERGSDGNPRLTVPVDMITAKEALALLLYALHPNQLADETLSTLLSSSWKTMKSEAVRARASELRRDGRLVADKGKYNLSGAGIQWVQNEVLPKLRKT